MNDKYATSPDSIALESLLEYFKSVLSKREDSCHHFKAIYFLENYKSASEFSVELSFKIFFDEVGYSIVCFIGEPGFSSDFAQSNGEFVSNVTEGELDSAKPFILIKNGYTSIPNSEIISVLKKQIIDKVLVYIKEKASGS